MPTGFLFPVANLLLKDSSRNVLSFLYIPKRNELSLSLLLDSLPHKSIVLLSIPVNILKPKIDTSLSYTYLIYNSLLIQLITHSYTYYDYQMYSRILIYYYWV